MKQVLIAVFLILMIANGASLLAQTRPSTPNEIDAIANEILQSSDEHRKAQTTATYWLDRYEKSLTEESQRGEKLKKDLERIKELLSSQNSGVVRTSNGHEVSVKMLDALAKQTMTKLKKLNSRSLNTKDIANDCRKAISDYESAEAEAIETAKEFKAASASFRQKLAMLQYAKSKFDSQFKLARELHNEKPRLELFEEGTPTRPAPTTTSNSASSFKALADEIESIASDLEAAGSHSEAEKLRKKARALLNRNGN